MITIFNRKELTITMDMKRQLEIRTILSNHQIDYNVKVTDLQSASVAGRARTGNLGIDRDWSYEYKIYVHKKDYDRAAALIGK